MKDNNYGLLSQEHINAFLDAMQQYSNTDLKEGLFEYVIDKEARINELGGDCVHFIKIAQSILFLFEDREMYEECAELVNNLPEIKK